MLLIPLEDIVVFPNMNVTLTIEVGSDDRVVLVPKHESAYAKVGTIAEVTDSALPRRGAWPWRSPACTAASAERPRATRAASSASRSRSARTSSRRGAIRELG